MKKPICAFLGFVGLLWCANAWAALTPIADSPDVHDEPNLMGTNPFPGNPNPSILETLYGESNLERIDDSNDIFFSHTGSLATVKAVAKFALGTHSFGFYPSGGGSFQPLIRLGGSGYGVTNLDPGTLAPIAGASFAPSASGNAFTLGLDNQTLSAMLSSDPAVNPLTTSLDHMVTFRIIGNAGRPSNVIGNLVLAWEERPDFRNDNDFQDDVFEIGGLRVVPEPATFWVAVASAMPLALLRRRRRV